VYTSRVICKVGSLLTEFTGSYWSLRDRPTGNWIDIGDRPLWTCKFDYSNVGPMMEPTEDNNLDITTFDSITPDNHDAYNLGQHQLRYRHVFARELHATTGIHFNGAWTNPFTGSYNELRDRPDTDYEVVEQWISDSLNRGLYQVGVTRLSNGVVRTRLANGSILSQLTPGTTTQPNLSLLAIHTTVYEYVNNITTNPILQKNNVALACSTATTASLITWWSSPIDTTATVASNLVKIILRGVCLYKTLTRSVPVGKTVTIAAGDLTYNTEIMYYL